MSGGDMGFGPVTLAGRHVRLEPLSLAHLDALCAVGLDPDLWQWTQAVLRSRADLLAYVQAALAGQAAGDLLPFATVDLASGRVAGSTRFANIVRAHRRAEIGWTWLGREFQRTAVNTEAKLLMMTHAFEAMGCIRVELKTDVLNQRSRAAIRRLGAVEEGVLRAHAITDSGRVRDTVYYSVLAREWPGVKAGLVAKLATPERRGGEPAGS